MFVDDDPQVFEGLQRMLAPQHAHWETSFAPDGDTVLLLLSATPFDAVVSDLRMPGMDGAALLKKVRQQWPGVVRIVLSGRHEMEDALRAVPVAHHHLPGRIPSRTVDAVGTVHIANVPAHQHPVYPPAIELLPPRSARMEYGVAHGYAARRTRLGR